MNIYSIFQSIDGEVGSQQGGFTTFIRFAGCNAACHWCDSKYAREKDCGRSMSVDEVVRKTLEIADGCKHVTITGGEPLMQSEQLYYLLLKLKGHAFISLETNGSYKIRDTINYLIDTVIMDYKTPSSKMQDMMHLDNFSNLYEGDWIKFVIADRDDYEFAVRKIEELQFDYMYMGEPKIAFSPVYGALDANSIIEWLKEDKLYDIVINVQLHKLLNIREAD